MHNSPAGTVVPSGHSTGGAVVAAGQVSTAGACRAGHSVGELVAVGREVGEPPVAELPRVGEVDVVVDVGLALVLAVVVVVVVVSVGAPPLPQAVMAPEPKASITAAKTITVMETPFQRSALTVPRSPREMRIPHIAPPGSA